MCNTGQLRSSLIFAAMNLHGVFINCVSRDFLLPDEITEIVCKVPEITRLRLFCSLGLSLNSISSCHVWSLDCDGGDYLITDKTSQDCKYKES
jgi:hypothetical protein